MHRLHDGRITDGMQAHLPAKPRARVHHFLKLFVGVAALSAKPRHALVVGKRPGCWAGESAIDGGLADGTETHPLIAVSRVMRVALQSLSAGIADVKRDARQIGAVLVVDGAHAPVRCAARRIGDTALAHGLIIDRAAGLYNARDAEWGQGS